jgi:hypothetical protein
VGRGARSNQRREGRVIGLTRLVEVAATSSPNPVSRGDHWRSGVDKTHRRREMTTLCFDSKESTWKKKGRIGGGVGEAPCSQPERVRGAWCGVHHAAEEMRGGGVLTVGSDAPPTGLATGRAA